MNDPTLVTNAAACMGCGTPSGAACGCAAEPPAPTANYFGMPGGAPSSACFGAAPPPPPQAVDWQAMFEGDYAARRLTANGGQAKAPVPIPVPPPTVNASGELPLRVIDAARYGFPG